jgi:tetratricopeptide (TPR) repeat protein
MRCRKQILGLGLLLTVATSVPAFAQPSGQAYPQCTKTVSSSESEIAHQKYIAGKQDYDEGNYDSAIRRFRDSYALDCTKHELLIIISAAYERKGDKKEAIEALETYVARAPSAPDVGTYQAKIENLKKQLAAATPPPPATTAPPANPPPSAETSSGHSPWPWVMVGVGGAAVIAGVIVMLIAPDLPPGCDESTETCKYLNPNVSDTPVGNQQKPSDEEARDLAARRETAGKALAQPKIGLGIAIGGGVLVAGGLLWHFLEPTGSKETGKTKLRPNLAPGYAGLTLGGSF